MFLTGEFDNEFLDEVKSLSPPSPQDGDELQTVANDEEHDTIVAAEQRAIAKNNDDLAAKRRKTYLNSEIPVRPCTDNCPKRETCRDFSMGRVADRELCRPELRQIKKWQKAFRSGNMEEIKDDAGAVAGALALQVHRLIEQAIIDGVVVDTLKSNAYGTYKEKMAHPAIQQAANICKTLGISLSEFLMTPKSQKESGPSTVVNIGVSADAIQARFQARFVEPAQKTIDVEVSDG